MATLLLFLDGIGVGRDDPETNPFAADGIRRLAPLAGREPVDGAAFRPLDATLGVPGLPQSATGQTTLFTGVNAAAEIGRHQTGLPGPSLWPLIERESLFLKLVRTGARPAFANAYPRAYFEAKRRRFGATTRVVMASGERLRTLEDDEARDAALPHDYTGEWLEARGIPSKRRDARAAAWVLASLLDEHDFVLYEYFLTDLAAHRGTRDQRFDQARRVETLVDACIEGVDLARHRVAVVSDHGNLEEAHHDRHTRNPAPLLAWGAGAERLVERVTGFTELTPGIVEG
ncbi:MAG TPA: hypothetical protein VF139_00150 [Candidatus Polarisedimenticolaceae bacterium]